MRIVPDYVYRFSFKSALSAIDGTYKVVSILSYSEIIAQNIDIFTTTYEPNGLARDAFNADLDTIRVGQIVKLTSTEDITDVQYIPEHLFAEIPDGSVQKYLKLGLAVNLGTFDDADALSVLKTELEQTVSAMTGITNSAVIYTIDDAWMTAAEYKAIDDARIAEISRVSNHYTDKLELIKQVDQLRTLITYYENTLKVLQAPI